MSPSEVLAHTASFGEQICGKRLVCYDGEWPKPLVLQVQVPLFVSDDCHRGMDDQMMTRLEYSPIDHVSLLKLLPFLSTPLNDDRYRPCLPEITLLQGHERRRMCGGAAVSDFLPDSFRPQLERLRNCALAVRIVTYKGVVRAAKPGNLFVHIRPLSPVAWGGSPLKSIFVEILRSIQEPVEAIAGHEPDVVGYSPYDIM